MEKAEYFIGGAGFLLCGILLLYMSIKNFYAYYLIAVGLIFLFMWYRRFIKKPLGFDTKIFEYLFLTLGSYRFSRSFVIWGSVFLTTVSITSAISPYLPISEWVKGPVFISSLVFSIAGLMFLIYGIRTEWSTKLREMTSGFIIVLASLITAVVVFSSSSFNETISSKFGIPILFLPIFSIVFGIYVIFKVRNLRV